MKRTLPLSLILCIILSLFGCSNNNSDSDTSKNLIDYLEDNFEDEISQYNEKVERDFYSSLFTSGDGTNENPYIIYTAEELKNFASILNDPQNNYHFRGIHIKLGNDIRLNDTAAENWTDSAEEWIPIGISFFQSFQGTFDGADYTIYGLYSTTGGLFNILRDGMLKNLSIKDSYITAAEDAYCGAFVNFADFSTIENCVNYATVFGNGIAGGTNHIITNCINYGDVSRSQSNIVECGGIVGINDGTITNCTNYGKISAFRAGGIAGKSNKTIENCYNEGEVSGDQTGGILVFGSAKNCHNSGKVIGTDYASGIVYMGSAEYCSNFGTVTAKDASGIAHSISGSIINCHNSGTIVGKQIASGIASNNSEKDYISYSYNTGKITATDELANSSGIVDQNFGTVDACCNMGEIYANHAVGISQINAGTITNCYNSGTIRGEYASGICYMNGAEFSDGNIIKGTVSCCFDIGVEEGNKTKHIAFLDLGNSRIMNCYFLDESVLDDDFISGDPNEGPITVTETILDKDKKPINDETRIRVRGLSKEHFKDKSVFREFDFKKYWKMNDDGDFEHPILIMQTEE